MSLTQQTLENELIAAKTALAGGDFNGARLQLTNAEITLVALADYGIGNRFVRYRQGQIASLRKTIDALETKVPSASKNNRVFGRYTRV